MQHSKMNIRLAPSTRMEEKGGAEHSLIRVPHRARAHFNATGNRFLVTVGAKTEALTIKPAYKEDIDKLKIEIKSSIITTEQAVCSGFVSVQTFKRLVGRRKNNIEEHSFVTDSVEEIKVGADPEFALVNPSTESFVYAQHIPGLSITGKLGHDGPLAELRPSPSGDVDGLVKNISDLLKKDNNNIKGYNWLGGATYRNPKKPEDRVVQIGGHLHFGNPLLLPMDCKTAAYERVVRVLDELVALPLVRVDCPEPYIRRNHNQGVANGYGRRGDWKPQEGRFEWRVPSGLWLVHPHLAKTIIGVSKAVVEHSYRLMAEKSFDTDWVCAHETSNGFLKTMGMSDITKVDKLINGACPKTITESLLSKTKTKLQGLSNYEKYKEEIDEFTTLIKMSDSDRDKLSLDLKHGWLEGKSIFK